MLTKRPVPLVVARLSGPGNSRERHSTPSTCAAHPRNAVCTPAACQTSVRLHEKRALTVWHNGAEARSSRRRVNVSAAAAPPRQTDRERAGRGGFGEYTWSLPAQ